MMSPSERVELLRRYAMPTLVALVCLGTPIASYFGFHHVVQSRVFLVDEVQVEGLVELSRDEVLAAAGLARPRNVLTCRARSIEAAIHALPWVREVEVQVSLQGRIDIRVREAEAWGIAALDDLMLVDADGGPIRPWVPTDDPALPLVVGVGDGGEIDPAAFADARRVVEAWGTRFDEAGMAVREVHRHPVHGFRVVRADGVEVRIGADRVAERLDRLAEVDAVLRRESRAATRILIEGQDLQRVSVRLAENEMAGGGE